MGKINEPFVAEAENYLSSLFAEKLPENIIFHDFQHVLRIKKYAETIGEQAGLASGEMDLLRFCALFKDAGYVHSYDNYPEESISLATAFLAGHQADPFVIEQVKNILRATQTPQDPKDKIAEILCDASMMYIATESAIEQFDLQFEEASLVKPGECKRPAYEKKWIELFEKHTYYTDYSKNVLQPEKEAVVKRLTDRLKRRKPAEEKKGAASNKKITYSRGVDTMFRVTARNQINLNSIADNKSNILISVNAIIISIIITMLAGNIGNMSKDIIPILVLLVICLATIIIAILSTRPNIVTRKFTVADIQSHKVDLNFFGNFIKMDYDDYLAAVKDMIKDDEYLYSVLLKNQYELGKILAKKFRLVRMAYNVFMIGIILTVIVFIVNYMMIHR